MFNKNLFIYIIIKPQTQEMIKNFTLKSKIISILTDTNFFPLKFIQAFSFLHEHQFIQPSLVGEKWNVQSQYINSTSRQWS